MARLGRMRRYYTHRGERGISLAFVVIAIFALLGMAALAIDLATLYVGRAQAQRVADAAALAGAKTLVASGMTADPANTQGSWATICAQAIAQAQGIGSQESIGGAPPASVTPCFPNGGSCSTACPSATAIGTGFGVNPKVSVTVQSAPMPLFLAKIWGNSTATVEATGLAEGFNPSGTNIPVASKCVTPWLLPNIDPSNGEWIFDPVNGPIMNNEPTTPGDPEGVVGRSIQLVTGCVGGCGSPSVPVRVVGPPMKLTYYPLDLPNPATTWPSCSPVGATTYQTNITSCNPTPLACGQTVNLSATATLAGNIAGNEQAMECRTGATGAGLGKNQDTLDVSNYPFEIDAGGTHNGVTTGTQISTSRSVVTIPVYGSWPSGGPYTAPASPVTILGYVQAFVNSSSGGNPTITILNISGCSATARSSTVPPVGLNEGSPVPVRLIHN